MRALGVKKRSRNKGAMISWKYRGETSSVASSGWTRQQMDIEDKQSGPMAWLPPIWTGPP